MSLIFQNNYILYTTYVCCDLSLSALSCCKSVFYLLEEVNGHMGM